MSFYGRGRETWALFINFLFVCLKVKLHLSFNNQLNFHFLKLSSKLEHKHSIAFLKIIFWTSMCYPLNGIINLGKTVCSIPLSILSVEPRILYKEFSVAIATFGSNNSDCILSFRCVSCTEMSIFQVIHM